MSNIQTHHANGREYLLIPIPEEHSDPRYFMIPHGGTLLAYSHGKTVIAEFIKLPEGAWKIIAFASSITEEEASELVERVGELFYSYDLPFSCQSARESLSSLLSSLGMGEGNTLILKRQ